jgi:hypothetical protein
MNGRCCSQLADMVRSWPRLELILYRQCRTAASVVSPVRSSSRGLSTQFLATVKEEIARCTQQEAAWLSTPESKSVLQKAGVVPTAHSVAITSSSTPRLPRSFRSYDNMRSYLRGRGFDGEDGPEYRVLSSLYSFPLTLAHALNEVIVSDSLHADAPVDKLTELDILVVGARAESSLPLMWWSECLHACLPHIAGLSINMVGPQMQAPRPSKHNNRVSWKPLCDGTTAEARYLKLIHSNGGQVPLDQHPHVKDILRQSDVFVLYNPGIGSTEELKQSWRDTMILLLNTRKPLIMTAHSERDMERDLQYLDMLMSELLSDKNTANSDNNALGFIQVLVEPMMNPFVSGKRTFDDKEIDACKVVAANQYVYAIHGN